MRPAPALPTGTVTFLFTDIEGSTRLLQQLGDEYPALYNVGFPTLISKADIQRSRAAFEECLPIARELGDKDLIARVLWGLGNAHYYAAENEAARDVLLEDVALFRTMDDPFGLSWALHTLGLACYRLGQSRSHAVPLWREAMEHFAAVGDVSGITILLGDFGLDAVSEGDLPRAVRLKAASERLATAGGTGLGNLFHELEQTYAGIQTLDPVDLQAAVESGLAMTVEQAVEYALIATPLTSPR
jgi:tetratricopeptide (TPR) repeat protein